MRVVHGSPRFGYVALDRGCKSPTRTNSHANPKKGLGDTTHLIGPDTGTTSFTSYDAASNQHRHLRL